MSGWALSDNAADSLPLGPSPEEEAREMVAMLTEVAVCMEAQTNYRSMTSADVSPPYIWDAGGGVSLLRVDLDQNRYLTLGWPDDGWAFAVVHAGGGGYNIQLDEPQRYHDLSTSQWLARMAIAIVMWWSYGARLQTMPDFIRSVEVF